MAEWSLLPLCKTQILPTLPDVIGIVLVVLGAVVSVFAFPPFGPGWLIVFGITLFLTGLRQANSRRQGLLYGAVYGLAFFSGLLWWISELGLIAVTPLVLAMSVFPAAYGWWLAFYNDRSPMTWYLLAVGGWGLMELVRYHFPVGGFEWGAAGYALSGQAWTRWPAPYLGTTGLTVMVVLVSALLALVATRSFTPWALTPISGVLAVALVFGATYSQGSSSSGDLTVHVVQGSTPCPFEHCPPDERLRTYEQHLELTRTIDEEAWLVVWSEGSTGAFNADPVMTPEVGEAIAAEARRLGAWFLVGSDRPLDDEVWINANVVFNPEGEIVGEYRKQHPVPFGEYIPFRPLFDWIPDLSAVPRDMIPGDGPVVFDLDGIMMGSVISFEGGFSRYALEHVRDGARLLVVATNEGSYGTTPGSDQFIGMTRMRAAELGMDVIHSAVTGKSVIIDAGGDLEPGITGLGTMEILKGTVATSDEKTPYTRYGDFVLWAAAVTSVVMWWRTSPLVGSGLEVSKEG